MKFRGSTLIELVVAMAVVTLLMGVSAGVLGHTREHARTVVCASRIRRLAQGLVSYQTENGTFPYGFRMRSSPVRSRDQYAGSAGAVDLPGWWWFDSFLTVDHATGAGEEVLVCPSKRQDHVSLAADVLCGNYGANLSLCRVEGYTSPYVSSFGGPALSCGQIPRPAETLLLVDSGYALISWWHASERSPVSLPPASLLLGGVQHAAYVPGMAINAEKEALLPGQHDDAKGGRHPHKTVNVGFADGSTALRKADDLLVERTAEGRWNNSPLWHPHGDTVTGAQTAP
ncbi:MAG TPA: prepilin-type N-terminal cleavage/methylation domain-containing protein [Sedimentisphaerales bacterium]|jgi:prepilin-type processing-associated H-X9-DG protein|nr:prepilin-type N-terminal cleavage/methylation domain-containing protein [Sedimentisphaerales bacterium]HNU27682.1 prepilin-type N-terminal cleavage/methylation domain-containing protein [Sedimentisphaerales bacterium]